MMTPGGLHGAPCPGCVDTGLLTGCGAGASTGTTHPCAVTTPGGLHGAPCDTGSDGCDAGVTSGSTSTGGAVGSTVAATDPGPVPWAGATVAGVGSGDGVGSMTTSTPTAEKIARPALVCGATATKVPRAIMAANAIDVANLFMTDVLTIPALKCQAHSSEETHSSEEMVESLATARCTGRRISGRLATC